MRSAGALMSDEQQSDRLIVEKIGCYLSDTLLDRQIDQA